MRTITLLSVLGAAACTPQQGPFFVSAIRPTDGQCNPPMMATNTTIVGFPTIDVRADPSLFVAAEVDGFGDLAQGQQAQLVGTRVLASGAREHGLVQRVVLRYASKPAIPGISAQTVDTIPLSMTITGSKALMPVQLFGPILRSKLRDLAPSDEDTYDFTVSFEVHGVLDQSQQPWHTAPFSLSMTLVNSNVMCATGDNRFMRFGPKSSCQSAGVFERVTAAQCCGLVPPAVDGRPGCDKNL